MANKIALFDMDGTLADYEGQMYQDFHRLMCPEEGPLDLWNPPKWAENRMDLIKRQPGWWLNLPKLDLGFEILRLAMSIGFDIHVLTKGPYKTTQAWTEKVEWCRLHLPKEVKVTITEDKSTVYGRVLVDDYVPYMEGWLERRPRGLGIMPAANHNRDFNHKQVVRYDSTNINLIKNSLKWAFNRADGQPT